MKSISDIEPDSTLDVGCGPGELLISLKSERPSMTLTGVDFSPAVIAANRSAMPFAEFAVVDLAEPQTLEDVYDLVICSEVIEHLDNWRVGVRHLASMVRDGGHLLITCPTGRIYETERTFGHVEHPKPSDLISSATDHGLSLVRFQNWGFPMYRALKALTNINSECALDAFGSGEYGILERFVSRAAYWATSLSFPSSSRGCQIVALFRKEDTTGHDTVRQ